MKPALLVYQLLLAIICTFYGQLGFKVSYSVIHYLIANKAIALGPLPWWVLYGIQGRHCMPAVQEVQNFEFHLGKSFTTDHTIWDV